MKRIFMGAVLALASLSALQAAIAVSNPNGTGQWYNGVAPSGSGANAFWDNGSLDGQGCNIGYWLASTDWNTLGASCNNASWTGNGPGANLAFFAGTASAATPVGWSITGTEAHALNLRLEVAGNRTSNAFGYLIKDAVGNTVVGPIELFSGASAPGAFNQTIQLAAGQHLVFYLDPGGNTSTRIFSDTSYSSTDTKSGKFALFSEVPNNAALLNSGRGGLSTYWVGVEDGNDQTAERWGDFQDFVVQVSVVPEPGFVALLSLGMGGLMFAAYRRKRQAAQN
jgi:hypothetical protein